MIIPVSTQCVTLCANDLTALTYYLSLQSSLPTTLPSALPTFVLLKFTFACR